jgi:hypothetical protein
MKYSSWLGLFLCIIASQTCFADTEMLGQTKAGELTLRLHREVKDGNFIAIEQQGREIQRIPLLQLEAGKQKIRFQDIDFDGHADLWLPGKPGAAALSEVYLFDAASKRFVHHDELSNLPCLEVNAKNKTVSGTCFREDACEKWTELYKFDAGSRLILTEKKGTYCIPGTADKEYFSYVQKYGKGKLIDSKIKTIKLK